MGKILLMEAFFSGSHKQLIDLLSSECGSNANVYVMKGSKWHWRSRTAALHFSTIIPTIDKQEFSTLFTSSVLNLAELMALRPDLAQLHKVLYFHENQLIYPKQQQKQRDFQYGYNQILSWY